MKRLRRPSIALTSICPKCKHTWDGLWWTTLRRCVKCGHEWSIPANKKGRPSEA